MAKIIVLVLLLLIFSGFKKLVRLAIVLGLIVLVAREVNLLYIKKNGHSLFSHQRTCSFCNHGNRA